MVRYQSPGIYDPSQIELKEPFWLLRRSYCSVINLAHVREPFVAPSGAMWPNGSPRWARLITEQMAPFLEPKWPD